MTLRWPRIAAAPGVSGGLGCMVVSEGGEVQTSRVGVLLGTVYAIGFGILAGVAVGGMVLIAPFAIAYDLIRSGLRFAARRR